MRFIADRKQMQTICRNLARLVPETSPIEDLTGILIEADEDSGGLRLVATNLEITLEYRCEAVVAEGGRIVLNGNLLASMIPLLGGDQVSFGTLTGANIVRIVCDTTSYELSYLPGKHFPETQTPPPESTVKLTGLTSLIKMTSFAVQKAPGSHNILANAKLDVYPAEAHMTCTDGAALAIARQKQENSNRVSMLIPLQALPLLAGVCADETVEAGISGAMLVFKGNSFILTTRTIQGVYPDTNALLSQVRPVYDAIVNARDFRNDADCLDTLFVPGMYVRIALRENGVVLFYESTLGTFTTVTYAVIYNDMPGECFYYNAADLNRTLRNMDGNLQIGIDRTGNMLLKNQNLCYLLTPRRPRKVEAAPVQEKKPDQKPKKKARKTAKAAKAENAA